MNCELNIQGNSFLFTIYFILYYFQWNYNSWEKIYEHLPLLCAALGMPDHIHEKFSWIFFHFSGCFVYMYQRILQSNWLKTFPATTQEEQFSQIWD